MKSETIEKARHYFPYLKNDIIYFNHASTGPISIKMKGRIEDFLRKRSEEKIDDYDEFRDVTDETKAMIGDMINCKADRVALLDNTTNGIIWLALGIDWRKGDRIILSDVEFPANVYPFLQLKEKGVKVDFIKSKNGIVTAEEVIDAIKPETKLISISFVQFLSGYKVDLELIGKVCKDKKIIFSVDSIQGLGAVRLDVEKCNIDFLANGTQKWLLGLQGLAFIYVRKELQQKMRTAPIGWLAVKDAWDFLNFDLTTKETAERFQPGTLNNLGIYAFNSSMKLFREFGFGEIEKQVLSNSKYFINKLAEISYTSPLLSLSENNLSGIVSFKSENAEKIFAHISRKKIVCSLREGYIRFAPHFYNTKQEIDKVVDELKKNITKLKSKNLKTKLGFSMSFTALKILLNIFLLVIFIIGNLSVKIYSQQKEEVRKSPKAIVKQTVGFTDVTIEYSRPGVKDRIIWGNLVPYNAVWRAGANEATKITFSTNVKINGKKLKAGSYSFFTIPTTKNWTIIFNKVADQWGAFEYNDVEDALRIEVTPEKDDNYWQEWLAYTFSKTSDNTALVRLEWEKLKVPFMVEVEI